MFEFYNLKICHLSNIITAPSQNPVPEMHAHVVLHTVNVEKTAGFTLIFM
jgi:hypothetical protein